MSDLSSLQNFLCFALTTWWRDESSIPWNHLDYILGKDIMTFEHNLLDLHSALHEHGNGVFNYMVQKLEECNVLPTGQCFEASLLDIKYRFLWLQINNFNISVLDRGKEWFSSRQLCEKQALQNHFKQGILTVETACRCYVMNACNDLGCYCLCHSRPCTHPMVNFTPFLSECQCISVIRIEANDGEIISRAPCTKTTKHNTKFVFFLENSKRWITSVDSEPLSAYRQFTSNTLCQHGGKANPNSE